MTLKTAKTEILAASLTPQGHIHIETGEDNDDVLSITVPQDAADRIIAAFKAGYTCGFLHLVSSELA